MATQATSRFDDVIGCWVVEDEYGDIWEAVAVGTRAFLVQCADCEQFYGAVYTGRDGVGELHPRRSGDVEDGFDDNQRYQFRASGGWHQLDDAAAQ